MSVQLSIYPFLCFCEDAFNYLIVFAILLSAVNELASVSHCAHTHTVLSAELNRQFCVSNSIEERRRMSVCLLAVTKLCYCCYTNRLSCLFCGFWGDWKKERKKKVTDTHGYTQVIYPSLVFETFSATITETIVCNSACLGCRNLAMGSFFSGQYQLMRVANSRRLTVLCCCCSTKASLFFLFHSIANPSSEMSFCPSVLFWLQWRPSTQLQKPL